MKSVLKILLSYITFLIAADYPFTKEVAVYDTLHNQLITDNYRWLENDNNPEVQIWDDQQSDYAKKYLNNLPQTKILVERFKKLWKIDDESSPSEVLLSNRIFFSRKKKDQNRYVLFSKKDKNSAEELLLDPNKWEKNASLDYTQPSPDGNLVAYGKSYNGDEDSKLYIIDLQNKKVLPDSVQGRFQRICSWLLDNSGFYYYAKPRKGEVKSGDELYWHALYFHKIGTPSSADIKVFYDDKVKEYYHSGNVSEDGKYLLLYRSNFSMNELFLQRIGNKEKMQPVAQGFDGAYRADIVKNRLFITAEEKGRPKQLYVTSLDKPQRENWKPLIAPSTDKEKMLYISLTAGKIYAVFTENVCTKIKIFDLDGNFLRELPLPGIGSANLWGYFTKNDVWVAFSSFNHPNTTYKYDYDKNELIVVKKYPLDINTDNLVTEQIFYNSKDKTPVSMFIVHKKNLVKDGNNPVYLTGYGGFANSKTPDFSSSYLPWLEAGGVLAIPNLRGGGEYGEEWHQAGMRLNKQNTFDDFIAAAEYLTNEKYTNPQKLAIQGGSNGGLLIGAAITQRPELFRTALCKVPLLDMIRFHKFGLANIWTAEYGSPDDSLEFYNILKYSPYHNVKADTKYPAIYFTASVNDSRVAPLHARKMGALLQKRSVSDEPVLINIKKQAGHGGGADLDIEIERFAQEMAFLMDKVGINL